MILDYLDKNELKHKKTKYSFTSVAEVLHLSPPLILICLVYQNFQLIDKSIILLLSYIIDSFLKNIYII